MSDEFADAFEELLDAQEEARGERIKVRISGKPYDAFIEDVSVDEMKMLGGDGNNGGFRAICPVSRFTKEPEHGAEIQTGRFPPLAILSVNLRNGVTYEITAGDPVAND